MANSLFTPILNDRARAPHFFNGRLLTGEAMTDEQRAQRVANELLAQAVGDGLAYGLEVSRATLVDTIDRPVVTVKSGVAINCRGEILLLDADTQVQLVRPEHAVAAPNKIFRACTPVTTGTYIANAGVYLLTVSSIRAGNGLTQVSGLGDTPAGCNVKYIVDAVEFRLLELPVDEATLGDVTRLRNLVAYQCFGVDDLLDFARDPFGTTIEPHTLLDDITALTPCDVPLAILYWTATGGIQWIDLWAVRRRIAITSNASRHTMFSDRRLAAGEAMILQFAEEIGTSGFTAATSLIQAASSMRYLPPIGLIPLARTGSSGYTVNSFLAGVPRRDAEYIDAAALHSLFLEAVQHPPHDLHSNEMVWTYIVWQHDEQAVSNASRRRYAVFAHPHTRYRATARFDVAHWDYSNYSECCSGD